MSYVSLEFLVFVLLCGIIYALVPTKYRWTVLLAGSAAFYVASAGFRTAFIAASIGVLYGAGRLIQLQTESFKKQKQGLEKEERKALKKKFDGKKRVILAFTVLINLGILLVIKYTGFFMGTVHSIGSMLGADVFSNVIHFTLPLGISYYTLSGISYITDVYNGAVEAERNPMKLALFLMFFPHITEGPFARYSELSKTLFSGTQLSYERTVRGFLRILFGFTKKLILADRAAFAVNAVFSGSNEYGGISVIFAVMMYTFQIYAEFSGCMDIVSGVSEIFGVSMEENFRQPFFSKSIDEFWRRWHITLGAWLRDYIFYPITLSSGMKKLSSKAREHCGEYYGAILPVCVSLFFVWFSNGLWHGASWKYVFYGLYYYLIMMLGKLIKPLTDKIPVKRESGAYNAFSIARTNLIVLGGMLIFRSSSLTQAAAMVKSIFTSFSLEPITSGSLLQYENFNPLDFLLVLIGFAALIAIGVLKEKGVDVRAWIQKRPVVTWVTILAVCVLLVICGIYGEGSGASPFIYGQF